METSTIETMDKVTTNDDVLTMPIIFGENDLNVNLDLMDSIIGQTEAIGKLKFYAEAHSMGCHMPTLLFTGSHGLGKTFLSEMLAKTLNREFILINASDIKSVESFKEFIMDKVSGINPKTVLIDESHELNDKVGTLLLSLLNPNKNGYNDMAYDNNHDLRYDFNKINLIFATTDAHAMLAPLKNRCKSVYFHPYENHELISILKMYLPDIDFDCDIEDLSWACRGRARDAYLLSDEIRRYCTMKKTKSLNGKGWNTLKMILSIHAYGLYTEEVNLLHVLADHNRISAKNLAAYVGRDIKSVEDELEPRLKELGFIGSDSRGRFLTDKGKAYVLAN